MKLRGAALVLPAVLLAFSGSPGRAAEGPVPAAGQPKAPAAGSKVVVTVPTGGDYVAYIQENAAASPAPVPGRLELEPPAGAKKVTVYVLDRKSGYAGRKQVEVGAGKEARFAAPDFNLLQKVRIAATGKDDKPIKAGSVVLEDGAKTAHRKMIEAASIGQAEFDMVTSGSGRVTVVPEGGSAVTREVTLDVPKGETAQTIPFSMPEVTATVEPAAGTGNAPETPAANAPAASTPAANAPTPAAAPQNAPTAAPAAPAPVAPQVNIQVGPQAQPQTSTDYGGMFIGFLFLGALAFAAYVVARRKGITMDQVLTKLGIQPDTGVNTAGANVAAAPPRPGAAPAPPPIVSDPNQCPFCGQLKDPSGNCACTVQRGAGAPTAAPGGFGATPGTGPRLVATGGTYMGQVYPLSSGATMGRDPSNAVPMDRDTTASRRHAQITEMGGTFRIQDLGSSNGTFVNGARVTECTLTPGDEVTIGGTRFRFEV